MTAQPLFQREATSIGVLNDTRAAMNRLPDSPASTATNNTNAVDTAFCSPAPRVTLWRVVHQPTSFLRKMRQFSNTLAAAIVGEPPLRLARNSRRSLGIHSETLDQQSVSTCPSVRSQRSRTIELPARGNLCKSRLRYGCSPHVDHCDQPECESLMGSRSATTDMRALRAAAWLGRNQHNDSRGLPSRHRFATKFGKCVFTQVGLRNPPFPRASVSTFRY